MRKLTVKTVIMTIITLIYFLFSGCVAPSSPDTEVDLEIVFWESGLGSEYMYKINDEFKKLYPEINIHFKPSASVSTVPLYAAPGSNTVDLYFAPFPQYLNHKEFLEPLDGIAASNPVGEDITIGEKIGDTLEWMKSEDGELFVLPYATTVNGIVYNYDVFNEKDYKLPRTTQELISLCDIISDDKDENGKNYVPFIFFYGYWRYMYHAWMAQLDGLDKYFDTWAAVYTDSNNQRHENDVRSFTDYSIGTGRYEAINVMRKLLSPAANSYYGSSSLTHTDAQTRFLNGAALMIPNGNWVENEMKNIKNGPEIRMMKTPVISALGTKLGITENQLRAAVSYVDGTANAAETTLAQSLSPDKLEAVRVARSIMYTEMTQTTTFIPKYSVAKEAAKKYLQFYYTDISMKIMADTIQMPTPAQLTTELDISSWSNFAKDIYQLSQSYTPIFQSLRTEIFYKNNINSLFYEEPSLRFIYSQNQSNMWTLEQYINSEKNYYENVWPIYLNNIGLS